MSTIRTKRKARDIVLDLLADVNDRQNRRFFRVKLDLEDDFDFQVADDLPDQFAEHGAEITSHSLRSVLTENNGRQKVMTEFTFICRITHDVA